MKTILMILPLIFIICASVAASTKPSIQSTEFQISFWCGVPDYANTQESYQTIKDLGFTFAVQGFIYDLAKIKPTYYDDLDKMLKNCQAVGLKAMVFDPRLHHPCNLVNTKNWKKNYADIVSKYVKNPTVYGFDLHDEPNASHFQSLKEASDVIHKVDRDTFAYINLLPTYATTGQLGASSYEEYLDQYLKVVKPTVVCYDNYSLMLDGSTRPDYYENLELVRKYALKYDVIPWNGILSWSHNNAYAEPTDAQMRWQVYTSLASGMKGIMYFIYWAPKEWEKDNPHRAIVDYDGKPTRLGLGVKQLNTEMSVLGKTLMQLTSTDVYFTGNIPAGCKKLGMTNIIQLPSDKNLMIGFFKDKTGAQYAMIVNTDTVNPVDFNANFKLPYCAWDPNYKPAVTGLTEVSKTDNTQTPVTVTNNTAPIHLDPGDGKLFKLVTGP